MMTVVVVTVGVFVDISVSTIVPARLSGVAVLFLVGSFPPVHPILLRGFLLSIIGPLVHSLVVALFGFLVLEYKCENGPADLDGGLVFLDLVVLVQQNQSSELALIIEHQELPVHELEHCVHS